MQGRTFWRALLFLHFRWRHPLAAVTLQAVAVLMPARAAVGNFIGVSLPHRPSP
jgi:hypothetical protein